MASHSDALPGSITTGRLSQLAATVPANPGGSEFTVEAPYTGKAIGTVPSCAPADVRAAVKRARDAQADWADRPVDERAAVLLQFHDLVFDRRAELLDVTQLESGKARIDAFEELMDVATNARHYAHRAEQYLGSVDRKGALPLLTRTVEHRHPVGVVGVISPWNYPLTLAVSDAIPALLAGNSVVLKPASETPFAALLVRELLEEAGLPEGVFEVVTGRGSEVGPALVDEVDYVCFTGSTETGREVARRAGENLVDCSLELGGKNPMVVLADADLDAAAAGAVHGCFTNAGQLCISFERLYVQREVYDDFLDRFVRRTRAIDLRASYDWKADVGSLVSADQLETVEAHVDDAVGKGADLLVGGRARPDIGPYFYEPTVLSGVSGEMDIAREETFGPVVSVRPFDFADEAVALANDSAYGLNASVWTADSDRGREMARRIECGTVNVNDAYAAAWGSVDAPMGGMKDSGLGRRHGREGFLKYTESQTVAEQRAGSIRPPDWLPKGWYARGMSSALRLMERLPGVR
ncbi:succinic semialdehyde dehydrogenase (plasmid) [Halorussus salilacus]|uniref:succinic semialdehyde dehydrogenase n=1 Tax=Halorussus salilacus TaxID=2953750 RepID=UPI00209FAB14|nr:succinic semialdehyde dehydrogenase [Halorussus salilacus]USZ70148.1 succinic semialdehyde dehydrogenase [Halorussus salilacus]